MFARLAGEGSMPAAAIASRHTDGEGCDTLMVLSGAGNLILAQPRAVAAETTMPT